MKTTFKRAIHEQNKFTVENVLGIIWVSLCVMVVVMMSLLKQ